jgi:GNAT superfamily N-acetyltransferase
MTSPAIRLQQVEDPQLTGVARALFVEYAVAIGTDLAYQGFETELAGLPFPYVPPQGALVIAYVDGEIAGCVGLRPLGGGIGEMKRLYVREPFRALGLGKRLVQAVIDASRWAGYKELRLDTLASMDSAHALYLRMGFVEIPPYASDYPPGTRFFTLRVTG